MDQDTELARAFVARVKAARAKYHAMPALDQLARKGADRAAPAWRECWP